MIRPPLQHRPIDEVTRAVLIAVVSLFVGAVVWFGPSVAVARILGSM